MAREATPPLPDAGIGPPTRFDPAIYALLVGIIAVMLALLPATLISLGRTLLGRSGSYHAFPSGAGVDFDGASALASDGPFLNIALTDIDEMAHTATIAVSGRRACAGGCADDLVITLISYDRSSGLLRGAGQSVRVEAPRSGEAFSAIRVLPVEGWPGTYPFDRYRLRLGIAATLGTGGAATAIEVSQGPPVRATIQNATYDLTLLPPVEIPAAEVDDPADPFLPLGAMDIVLQRPLHLRVLSVALFTMIAVSTALGLFSRSLPAVVFGNAGLLLGIFSIRSVLVPYSITVVTAVDIACQVLILLMLLGLTVRIAGLIRRRSGLPVAPGARRGPRP
ncbi:MAG: hypothetical protein ACKOWF_18095 [Chloroflexota bacterium]